MELDCNFNNMDNGIVFILCSFLEDVIFDDVGFLIKMDNFKNGCE